MLDHPVGGALGPARCTFRLDAAWALTHTCDVPWPLQQWQLMHASSLLPPEYSASLSLADRLWCWAVEQQRAFPCTIPCAVPI